MIDDARQRVSRLATKLAWYSIRLTFWLWLLHLLTFVLFDLLPSSEFRIAGWAGIDPTILASTRQRLGLHGSLFERYWAHLLGVLHGDLGRSIVGDVAVSHLFATRLFASAPQWVASILLLLILPVPLGTQFCRRPLGGLSRVMLFSSHALLIPQFLACCAGQALYVFGISRWVPPEFDELSKRALAVLCASLAPLTIAFVSAANTAANCAEQPFVTAHLAIGASWQRVRHRVMLNVALSMRPLLARLALFVIVGSIFAEPMFSINGVGALFWDAIRTSDIPTMMAFVLFLGSVTITLTSVETTTR